MIVYLLLSKNKNEYDQPPKAFERLFWEKPTAKQMAEILGVMVDRVDFSGMLERGEDYNDGGVDYWIEEYKQ
jgi:hypothetical protein